MKSTSYISLLLISLLLGFSSCRKAAEEITTIDYDRVFSPTKLAITPAQTTATISWAVIPNATEYIVHICADSLIFGADITEYSTTSNTLTVSGLEGDKQYSVRVKGVSTVEGQDDSKWTAMAFKTVAEQIFIPILSSDIKKTSVTVKWDNTQTATHLLLRKEGAENQQIQLTTEELDLGIKKITGLTHSTPYTIDIYNGETRRGRMTFTTATMPVGDHVVLLSLEDNLKTAMADPANIGKTLYLPEGYTYTIDGTIDIAGTLTVFGDPDGDRPQIILNTSKAMNLPASADSLIFQNVELTSTNASSSWYLFNQSSAAAVKHLIFDNCIIKGFGNNILRLQGSQVITIDNFIVNQCVVSDCGNNRPSGGSYAFVNSNVEDGKVKHIRITNSTFFNMNHCFLNVVGKSNSCATESITIEDCTFDNLIGTGGSRYFIDGQSYGAIHIQLKNLILGKTMGADARGIRNGSTGQINTDRVYITSDHLTTNPSGDGAVNYDIPGTSAYSGASTDLWLDPAAGNFGFKDNSFSGKNNSGDPRWR